MVLLKKDTSPVLSNRGTVRTKLESIAQKARKDKKARFTSLYYLLNKGTLHEAFRRLNKSAAPGIDKETKDTYGQNLVENLQNLHERLKSSSYRPQPVKRIYIEKPGSNKLRPIGIPVLEDKIVQMAIVIILEPIYEEDFLEISYGFRTGRGQMDALKNLSKDIGLRKVNYVVDADIKGFFNHVDHEQMIEFLKHRIADKKILGLIKRFMKAGIMEDGQKKVTEEGVPQGGTLSPLLANIYLHYSLDLWFEKKVKKKSRGEAYITRFADDSVACFQYKEDAEIYYEELKVRLGKFKLEIAVEKTKIIEFGRFAERDAIRKGKGKPDTFDFLGFTHYCGRSRAGKFKLKWKTARKKFRIKVNEFAKWIKENRFKPRKEIWEKVNQKLQGHYQYYGVSDNWRNLTNYKREVEKLLYKWLNRRSQKRSKNLDEFEEFLKVYPLKNPKSLVNLNSAYV